MIRNRQQPLTGARRIAAAAAIFASMSLGAIVPIDRAQADDGNGRLIWGTWYLSLDAGPFLGFPNGQVFLSALATFNRDGTLLVYDAGDLGGFPFGRSTPQQGVWVQQGNQIMATTLFIEADSSGEVQRWVKVNSAFEWGPDHDRLSGTAAITMLPCDVNPGFPSPLRCPDPVESAADFVPEPFPPPEVPLPTHLHRLRVDD